MQVSRRFAALLPIVLISYSAKAQPFQRQQVTPWTSPAQAPKLLPVPPAPKLIPLSTSAWTPIGPGPLNEFGSNDSGRITGIAAHPTIANTIYVSPAGGGVWKTTDGGTTWTPQTDPQITLSMGAIAIARSNPSVIYAGTGESNNSADSNFGRGILKSTDGGATWTLQTGPAGVFNTRRLAVSEISVDPTNPLIAYAAFADFGNNGLCCSNTGIYKTIDGATWVNVTAAVGLDSTGPWSSVQIDPNTPATVYAAHGTAFTGAPGEAANGVYKSTDSGATWTLLSAAPLPSGITTGRFTVAVARTNNPVGGGPGHVVYVSVNDPNTFAVMKVVRSDNDGTSWTDVTPPNYMGGQGWYDTAIGIDPTNSAIVYVTGSAGANSMLRSTNSGGTWTDISGGAVSPHVDHHALTFDANGFLLDGDDGGIWRLADPTVPTWIDINGNLTTIQFTGIGLHPTNANIAIGGSQDNGTEVFTGAVLWTATDGGDGGYAKFNQANGTVAYHQIPNASFGTNFFRVSLNGGTTWTTQTGSGLAGDVNNQKFYAPFVANGNRVLYGTNRIWETLDATVPGMNNVVWTALGAVGNPASNIDSIGLAPSDANTIYTSKGGNTFVTTNHGALWTPINLPVAGQVQDIQVNPTTPTTAYAVINQFTASGANVFQTVNGGGLWTNITGNLATVTACLCALPVWSLQIDVANNRLFIGADDGVYVSTTLAGGTWSRFGTGLPNAQAVQIELNTGLNILGAGTHGRSMWEISTAPAPPVGPDFAITKTHIGNFTQLDAADTYTITVMNTGTGPTDGTTVTVVDTVPAGLTPTAATGTGWVCNIAAQTVTCTRTDVLSAGLSYPAITLTVSVLCTAPAAVTNSVMVTGGGVTADPDDTAMDPTTIIANPACVAAPDLAITKTHAPPGFTQGQNGAVYTITVTNTGTAATTGTTIVTDTLPAGLTFVSGAGGGFNCAAVLQVVTCPNPNPIAAGAMAVITLTVNVAANAGTPLTNMVAVSNGNVAGDPDDTAMDPTVIAAAPPDLSITKTHVGNFTQGDAADTYTITVKNTGTGPTTGTTTVTDTLPVGLTFVSGTGGGFNCSAVAQVVTCTNPGAIAAGASSVITLTVSVAANAPGTVTNSATVMNPNIVGDPDDTAMDPTIINPAGVPTLLDGTYQLRYLANLNQGDSYVNLTNAGTLSGFAPAGNICVNVYTFDPAEELISCCACPITPNGLVSLSARNDLISNTLTPGVPTSITVKLLSSLPTGTALTTCNASSPTAATLVRGMRAWATTLHLNTAALPAPGVYQKTETPFSVVELSASELSKLTGFCAFIQSNGSGFGICKSCRFGALGAGQQ